MLIFQNSLKRLYFERSQNTVLLVSTQAVYKAPHSTVRRAVTDSHSRTQTHVAVGSLRA